MGSSSSFVFQCSRWADEPGVSTWPGSAKDTRPTPLPPLQARHDPRTMLSTSLTGVCGLCACRLLGALDGLGFLAVAPSDRSSPTALASHRPSQSDRCAQ